MWTDIVEDSSEDEDSEVLKISQKLTLSALEKNNKVVEGTSLNTLSQVKAKNQNVFFYPASDSVECAETFNRNLPLDGKDPFIKKLIIVLKKCPSIKSKKLPGSKLKRQEPALSDKKINEHEDEEEQSTSTGQKTKNVSSKNKYTTLNDCSASSIFSNPLKQLDQDMTSEGYNESCMSESGKNKGINLVKMLCNSDDASFSSVFLDHKQEFLELLPQIDIIQDVIPQVIDVILKIFNLEHSSKRNILCSLTHDEFIGKMISYITLLPTECEETLSESEIENIFHNILLFCENINTTMPLKSAGVLRKVLLSLQYGVKGFKEVQNVNLDEKLSDKIKQLLENAIVQKPKESRKNKREKDENVAEPPDSVKDIDIFPSKKDLFEPATFLRKNVVDGSYRDVNHYIDVHFRLLREDFIAPMRSGLQLYCESIAKGHKDQQNQRFDNIIVHEGVKILHGTITNGRLGHLVQLTTDIGFQKNSKIFMFGSLVLFTADNFDYFFCGTVINSVGENLLIVELCNDKISLSEIYSKAFTMIESEVYFEPYFHVLSALQKFDCATFPMKEYIVDVKPNEVFKTQNVQSKCPSFLNESQKKAFNSAISNEFVVIQGPPGTGKTFLAEAIAKTLLLDKGPINKNHLTLLFDMSKESDKMRFEEYKIAWRQTRSKHFHHSQLNRPVFHKFFCEQEKDDKPILVICYTNHALDQFLERLVGYTDKLIRVGGQSKNPTVQDFNLNVIRRCWIKEQTYNCRRCKCGTCQYHIDKFNDYFELKKVVQNDTYCYLVCLKILEAIAVDGVVKGNNLTRWMSSGLCSILLREKQYEAWLLEGAYVLHIEDEDVNDDVEPKLIVHTQQLLSEFRESGAYRDDLEMYDVSSVESRSTAEADEQFCIKCSEVVSQSQNIQKKLRKCRQKGRNENRINMYENQIEDLEKQRRYIAYMLARKPPIDLKRIRELNRASNIWAIDFEDRWMLYNYWVQQYENKIKNIMFDVELSLKEEERHFTRTRDEFDLQLLKSANVLGMTTTSSARLRNILEKVGSEIVIVEEAAEVLESHIVVALNPKVKKVILIGDHKQLKPNPAVYELARKYKLDVSLFERMINNGLACQVLDTQQRMRPEIASLIAPAIYPNLKNGERVLDRPDIRGVAANVFFVTHNKFEDESYGDSRSHRNTHEVNFLASFCQYLLQQDYHPSEITILTTYLGQMTVLENEKRNGYLPSDLRIATVDNYQGEENDIILLSLVRSNAEARIGFLSAENRVCVALSRAKNGLYIIGNMDNLTQNNTIWRQVKAQLKSMNAIGPALPLGCKHHQNDKCLVSCRNDFKDVPISGCKLKCGAKLSCGHVCTEFCHSTDLRHTGQFACPLPCERMTCEEHRCTKTCGIDCGRCKVLVEKQLPCGHSDQFKCSSDLTLKRCKVMVEKQLACGHSVQLKCSADPTLELCEEKLTLTSDICGHIVTKMCHERRAFCHKPCTETMDCGHQCRSRCHYNIRDNDFKDPEHKQNYCHIAVEKDLGCGHTYKTTCNMSNGNILCREPCPKTLPCDHPCGNICGGPCSNSCDSLVEKTLSPCGHQLMLPCRSSSESSQCRQPCQLTLPCGHPCPGTCSTDCGRFTCQEKVLCGIEPACGHGLITIPCYLNATGPPASSDQLLQHCRAPCRADLPCGHLCLGRCGHCLQGRLHIPCSYPCARTLQCGHRCERECRDECPAICDRPCMFRCPHQACNQLCGEPCAPCQKACERRCRHQQCSRACGEDCDCPPCDEPCPSTLPCGHPCPAFCGEPCTKHCVVCSPDVFTVPGHTSNAGNRYVSLEDCGHPIEDNLLRKLIVAGRNRNQSKRCPICDEPIKFVLRFKDYIQELYSNLASAKAEENLKVAKFESMMKPQKYNLKYYSDNCLETYGDNAFFIFEHLKKAPLVYKTSMRVFTFFKELTKSDGFAHREDQSWNMIVERRKLLLAALSHRLKSMSSSDYNEFLTEIFRLELATKGWPTRSNLMLSLKKYSLDELKVLE